ncbi:MAG: hypothetical protein KatS3mg002_0290 [Candidatus Woesearchaeota archaeon]|nr:MAG: hypothetical protein KatS3mg002_0290 [Candidatus Woesearchaeota archaeon]
MTLNEIFLGMDVPAIQNKDFTQLRRDAIRIRNNISYNVGREILKEFYEVFHTDVEGLIMRVRNDEIQLKDTLVQIYNFLSERL